MNKLACAVAVALGLGFAASSQAAVPITIDPDGVGGLTGGYQVGNLDWSVGNALAVGPGTFGTRTLGTVFTLLAQAKLASFNNAANNPYIIGSLNNNYEWTYVTGFEEKITNVQGFGRQLEFQVNPNALAYDASKNFFHIYRSAPNSSDLGGRGFNDGALVLRGHIVIGNEVGDSGFNVAGNFVRDALGNIVGFNPTIATLDQFSGNSYDGANGSAAHQSITGTGSSSIKVVVDAFDAATFKNIDVGFEFSLEFNTSQILAYNQTDPSSCFWDGAAFVDGAGQTNPNQPAGQACGNSIGAINGVSGPNIMFQTDANNSFIATTVPEPGVLALLGISLLGLGLTRRRG